MEQDKSFSTPQQRITVIDALRGFALLGVILIHMLQHYGIFSFSGNEPGEALFPKLDVAIQWLSQNAIMGKFINIFAFLFGMSFFIQMDRAAKKGIDFRKRFLWRMAILFIIGLIGNCFYTGDILSIYAVFGILMVFLFRFKNWVLMILVSLLLIGTPRMLITGYNRIVNTEQVESGRTPMQSNSESRQSNTGRNASPASVNQEKPSFLKSAQNNLTTGLQRKLNYQFGMYGRGYITLALFILGLVVGRLRFFEKAQTLKKRNLMLLAGFVLSAILVNSIIDLFPQQSVSFRMFTRPGVPDVSTSILTTMALRDIYAVLFSGALVLGFIVLHQIKNVGRCLDVMSPYGRMGLTNYEMQSIIGTILFSMWGFGSTFGSWGTTEVFALGLIIYTAQIIASNYWMKYFQYGPFEWLWRSATYLKLQPIRKKK